MSKALDKLHASMIKNGLNPYGGTFVEPPIKKITLDQRTEAVVAAFAQLTIDMKEPPITQVVNNKYIMKIKNFAKLEIRIMK